MKPNSFSNEIKERALTCIERWLGIDARNVPILYVENFDFYKIIKNNYTIEKELYDDIERIKERYKLLCEIIQGLYKWKEKKVIIKVQERNNTGLLIAELLHSKSITQGHSQIKAWIREGLAHFLAEIICKKCNIEYFDSSYKYYYPLWQQVYERYGLNVLKTILYSENLKISIDILKSCLNYKNDDILELPFNKALKLLKKQKEL